MTRADWTREKDGHLRRHYLSCPSLRLLADSIRVTLPALKNRANKLGLTGRVRKDHRAWTADQLRIMRERYGTEPAAATALAVGRTVMQTYRKASVMGLATPTFRPDAAWLARLRRLHAEGRSDAEAAGVLGCDVKTAGNHRRAAGLPHNGYGPGYREKNAAVRARTLKLHGVESLGQLRGECYRRFAEESGWPRDLRMRSVQALNLLAARGVPMTRLEITAGIGASIRNVHNTLGSNDPEGSTLAHLAARGLVTRMPCAGPASHAGKRGRRVDLYCLGPSALAILSERAAKAAKEA